MAVVSPNPEEQSGQNVGAEKQSGEAIKLNEMFSRLGSQGSWAGEALDYLNSIRKSLEDPSMPLKIEMKYINDEAVAFSTTDKFSVVLLRSSDITNIQALATDARFYAARDAFYEAMPKNKLLNIVSCNRYMFNRASQMAAYINQTLSSRQNEAVQRFNVDMFSDRYRIMIDADMTNVRSFVDMHSPAPTVCADFGFIASVADMAERPNAAYQNNTPMFAATGYVEFIRHESSGTFTPMVHVTDIVSVMPNSKILALALPLIGEVFISRGLWRQPFTALGKSEVNLGNLIVDASGKPYEIKNDADFRTMFREYIGAPILCIDIPAGAPSIPGINRITRPQDNATLAAEIYNFLNISSDNVPTQIGENVFREIVGVYETSKTPKFSNLMDSREITYLWAVPKLKWSPKLDALLTRTEADPIRRFDMLRELAGDITPTHASITTVLYGNFIKTIAQVLASKVRVDLPQLAAMPVIDMSGFVEKSYQPGGLTMFGQPGGPGVVGGGWLRF